MRPAAALRRAVFLLLHAAALSIVASNAAAEPASFSWEWDAGPSWLRDAEIPGEAWPDLPASAPELSINASQVEGGDAAAWRNHEGDRARDGVHATLEAGGRARLGAHAALRLRPRAIASSSGASVSWLEALAVLRAGHASLEAGRTRLWLGPARHGSLLLSTNAHPLDLVHARFDGPARVRVPGFPDLASIGTGAAVAFLSDPRRDYPNPDLGVLYFASRWSSWLELSAYRTMLFAGEGRGFRLSWRSVGDLLSASRENASDPSSNKSDQLAAAAAAIRVDALVADARGKAPRSDGGAWLYYEYAGEDNVKGFLVRDRGVAIGGRWTMRAWEFSAEYARNYENPSIWYQHFVYTSGYTYRGVVLGHHMGGDANDLFVLAAAPLPGGRRLAVMTEWKDGLLARRAQHAEEWTLGGSVEGLARRGHAIVSVDWIARWGKRYPLDLLGPIERKRVSVRISWRPGRE